MVQDRLSLKLRELIRRNNLFLVSPIILSFLPPYPVLRLLFSPSHLSRTGKWRKTGHRAWAGFLGRNRQTAGFPASAGWRTGWQQLSCFPPRAREKGRQALYSFAPHCSQKIIFCPCISRHGLCRQFVNLFNDNCLIHLIFRNISTICASIPDSIYYRESPDDITSAKAVCWLFLYIIGGIP